MVTFQGGRDWLIDLGNDTNKIEGQKAYNLTGDYFGRNIIFMFVVVS